MYQQIRNQRTGTVDVINRYNTDGTVTSFVADPANTDYQEYLKWLAEGNAPYGADEPLPAEETK